MNNLDKYYNVLVTDYPFEDLNIENQIFQQSSLKINVIKFKSFNEEKVLNQAPKTDALLVFDSKIDSTIINNLSRCQIIVRYAVGLENIDVDLAKQREIEVANVPEYCISEVSDTAIALILNCARKINLLDRSVRRGEWDYKIAKPIYRINGKILGLLGFGKIAREVARKGSVFGLNIVAYDPYTSKTDMEKYKTKKVDFETLCRESDFLSCHVPLTEETRGLLGKKEFNMMKSSSCFINTSRGEVVDEKALIEALKKEKISCAALDTLRVEPIELDNPLINMNNTIINPHSAFYSEESLKTLRQAAAKKIVKKLQENC